MVLVRDEVDGFLSDWGIETGGVAAGGESSDPDIPHIRKKAEY
jgi:hypothetical protein